MQRAVCMFKTCLRGQHTNFHLLSLTWDSCKGGSRGDWRHLRRDWGQKFWGESSPWDPGAESSPIGSSHLAQADHSPPSSSSLRGINSPTPKRDFALALQCLSLIAECRVTMLINKEESHRCRSLAKGGRVLEMLEERLGMEAWHRELREWLPGSWC